MTNSAVLSGVTVLLTRPEPHSAEQAARLPAAIRALGGEVEILPLIQIEPLDEQELAPQTRTRIMNLDQYHKAIFVSTNAARLGMSWIDRYWPQLPTGLEAYAVGPGTGRVLQEFTWPVYWPDQGITSEDLLRLPRMQQVDGQRVALFRGVGGREVLAGTLRERGAIVDYLELYRRNPPAYDERVLIDLLERQPVAAAVVTSAQILEVMLQFVAGHISLLQDTVVIVPSERIRQLALEAGLPKVVNAGGADDDTTVTVLKALFHGRK